MAELYVALDHPDAPSAVDLLDLLPTGAPVKVGSVLMTRAGHGFVRSVLDAGHPVFLDLKWHDIPNTVHGAVTAAAELGVRMVTVHALGGTEMMQAAVEAAAGRLHVVAVTVLTSHDAAGFAHLTGRPMVDVGSEAARLAGIAMAAGVAGVVCSAHELEQVRPMVGSGRLVVPGIRRAGEDEGDQRRVATPEVALAGGATDLVVGRPITGAEKPGEAWAEFRRLIGP
ncbi:MAG: orotidine-5'-phosphate decarboxylase [Gemmatimonadales bacterium]